MMRELLRNIKMLRKKKGSQDDSIKNVNVVHLKSLPPAVKEIIVNAVTLKEKTVREIMIPRVDVFMVPIDSEYNDLVRKLSKFQNSRVPVYGDDIDDIVGVLYAKDLIGLSDSEKKKFQLKKVLHPPYFVPESKFIIDMLRSFKEKRVHLAAIVDEYGGFAGIVTLEDVLEQIVGAIHDEFDNIEETVKINDDGAYTVDARLKIDELNSAISVNLPAEEADTIGGFIFNYLGRLPKRAEVIEYKNYIFTVVGKSGNIVTKIRIEKKSAPRRENGHDETTEEAQEQTQGHGEQMKKKKSTSRTNAKKKSNTTEKKGESTKKKSTRKTPKS